MRILKTTLLVGALTVLLPLFAVSSAQAYAFTGFGAVTLPYVGYSIDVEIAHGGHLGLSDGDILLDAGVVRVDQSTVTRVGVETAAVVDFSLVLGTEVFDFQPGPIIYDIPGWGTYATANLATFTDGVLTGISLAAVSQNGLLLELGGQFTTGTLGQLSLMADTYYVGEVNGTYSVNTVPEPSAGLLYALGTALTLGVLRRR